MVHPWCLLSVVGLEEYSAHDWWATTPVQRAPVTWREWGLWCGYLLGTQIPADIVTPQLTDWRQLDRMTPSEFLRSRLGPLMCNGIVTEPWGPNVDFRRLPKLLWMLWLYNRWTGGRSLKFYETVSAHTCATAWSLTCRALADILVGHTNFCGCCSSITTWPLRASHLLWNCLGP